MRRNTFGSLRTLHDVDAPGGSGAAPVTPPVTPADGTQPTTPPVTPTRDDGSAMRYQISRERDMRIKAEADRAELEKLLKTPKPVFDESTDPDGKNEMDFKIQEGIRNGLKDHIKELGLSETLEKIQYEREQESFFKQVEEAIPQFTSLGVEAPSRQELQKTLETIDQKGITREQLILLSRAEQVLGLLKPKGFEPGDGGKPTDIGRAKTQEEINADIFKAHKAFGY